MRKLLVKVQRQFSLDYIQEAKINMEKMVEQAKGVFDEDVGYNLASLFFRLSDWKTTLKIVTGVQPPNMQKTPRILNLKGMCCMRLNKLKEAAELFEMCILMDPNYVSSLNNLGNIAMHNKDYDKCKLYYSKSKESKLELTRESSRLGNKAIACFNMAIAFLFTDDRIGMLNQISELELYLTPDMGVYKCLIISGFVHFLFKGGLIPYMVALEELLQFAMMGEEPFILDSEAAEGT
jgi:tetratricopeptide (TPR) repeat protein